LKEKKHPAGIQIFFRREEVFKPELLKTKGWYWQKNKE